MTRRMPGSESATAVSGGNRPGLASPHTGNAPAVDAMRACDCSLTIECSTILIEPITEGLDYTQQSRKFASVQDLNSGINARRGRIGVTGKFAGDWTYPLIYDFGGSTDTSPGASAATRF